ncbi:MAG: ribonuclease J [Lachnospiraceae bacterium]|nr:ribonuclease J [Lachnospiraceae bacterium]
MTRRKKKTTENAKVRIIPLGGLEEIGMNITAIETEENIVVVDCGMAFPDDATTPGIDLVIPDITYLKERLDKVRGFFITHGHEDHIGALPYVLREINVPVYGTRLTTALIRHKIEEADIADMAKINTVSFGDVIEAGDMSVEFIKTNHSIQDAAALAIRTPAGTLLHTGDFKVDYTPVFGDHIDLQRIAELGSEGVLALMCDSTNAIREGFTSSESTVGEVFDTVVQNNPDKRIIIATFASNVDRVQQIITTAERFGRKVCIDGRSMVNVINTAVELGLVSVQAGTLIEIGQLKDYAPEKTILVATGSQGESMAALSRMATGQHKKVSINAGDVVIISSTPIPGNEKAVAKVINELCHKHAEVVYQDTHVSGHACEEEIKLIYSLVHPHFTIPVHGEFRHRLAQKNIARQMGLAEDNIKLIDTGDVLELTPGSCELVDHVQSGPIYVDGLGVGDVGNIVIRDRQNLAANGIIIVPITLDKTTGEVLSGPDIVTRGFVYVRENEDLIEDARNVVLDTLEEFRGKKSKNWTTLKGKVRDDLSDYIWRRMKRNPIILPIIMEA